jgi:hypothetical protein
MEEYFIEKILDLCRRGRGWQFLVRWSGYGPEHNLWLAALALDECAALDEWYVKGGGWSGEQRRSGMRPGHRWKGLFPTTSVGFFAPLSN